MSEVAAAGMQEIILGIVIAIFASITGAVLIIYRRGATQQAFISTNEKGITTQISPQLNQQLLAEKMYNLVVLAKEVEAKAENIKNYAQQKVEIRKQKTKQER